MSKTIEKISLAIIESGLSKAEIARRIGVRRENFQKVFTSKDIKAELLEKIAIAVGKPITYFFDESVSGIPSVTEISVLDIDSITSNKIQEGKKITISELIPVDAEKHVVINYSSNDMSPTIPESAKILCQEIAEKDWTYLTGIIAIHFAEQLSVKRVQLNALATDGAITLSSDNPKGSSVSVKKSDIHRIWKVERILDAEVN